jgi:hypothetical protein
MGLPFGAQLLGFEGAYQMKRPASLPACPGYEPLGTVLAYDVAGTDRGNGNLGLRQRCANVG